MNKTVVGLFRSFDDAQRALEALAQWGTNISDISLVAPQAQAQERPEDGGGQGTNGLRSAARLSLPDGGTVVVAGPLAVSLANGGGRARSGLAEGLATLDIPQAQAQAYADAVRRGAALVAVSSNEARVEGAAAILEKDSIDVAQAGDAQGQGEVTLPVVQEELQVGKREVQRGGVRVYSRVSEQPVEEQVRLREERVTVERHPVDRPVSGADAEAFREGSFEVRQRGEEVVINKEARVVEEVVVSKTATERTETVRDTLRRTEVEVEPIAPTPGQAAGAPAAPYDRYEPAFRDNFQSNYAGTGVDYDQCEPAYRHGYSMATDARHRGRSWDEVEAQARGQWEGRSPGTWDRFKAAVRHAWEKVSGVDDDAARGGRGQGGAP